MNVLDKLFNKKESIENVDQLKWLELTSVKDLDAAIEVSYKKPVMLFKHSTRCSISSSALNRITRNWNSKDVNIDSYFLDLIVHRDVSNAIATNLHVDHQSPQMIIIKDGSAVFNSSHMEIDFNDVKEYASVN